ncbi:MAG: glycoside hydrolase family 31 protein [Deltaproteobacteria bacterium]|nr:glycoside hydrolase family 31 protein [Deltaproteobacteria bacterium]
MKTCMDNKSPNRSDPAVTKKLIFQILLPAWLFVCFTTSSCSNNSGNNGDADIDTDTDTDTDANTDMVLENGGFSIRVSRSKSSISLESPEKPLLVFESSGIQLGRVRKVTDNTSYDPWPLKASPDELIAPYTPPKGLAWLAAKDIIPADKRDRSASVQLSFDGGIRADLEISMNEEQGSFTLDLVPKDGFDNVAYFRLKPRCDPAEGLYGLGGHLDDVNHRGRVRAMQLEMDASVESGYNEIHVPVPLLIGTTGWGIFVESLYPGVFGVADRQDDVIDIIYGTGTASNKGIRFHLFSADDPLDITNQYYKITGYPKLPAPWALGPWVWRDEVKDQEQVLSDITTMRNLDLACSGYWIDRPYASGVNSFDFDPAMFDDPQAMIDQAHNLGYRMALWHTPYLDKNDPSVADLRKIADENNYFPPVHGITSKWGAPIDLTNPDAYSWWQTLIDRYTDMGIEGFKLDYAEEVVLGLPGARNKWEFFDKSDERTMNHVYQKLYHRVYAEKLPNDGGFLLCRTGMYGDQVNGTIIWPGDLDATMTERGEPFTEHGGQKVDSGVGGLPASLLYGLSLGVSGFPFYGSDTGGYRSSPPDKETFMRWFEQTALSSVMQIGTSSNDVAWEFTKDNGFDQEVLDNYRIYVRLHLRLFPYEWTLANNMLKDGRPIERPLGMQYPEMGVHPKYTYMFGDDLLVSPVVKKGATQKDVFFPEGSWIDWWNGKTFQQGERTVDAPLDKLPLFIRIGALVPMLRPTIDTLAPTTEPGKVDSYVTDPGILYVRVAAGADGSFTVFDETKLSQKKNTSGMEIGAQPGSKFKKGFWFEIMGLGSKVPKTVSDNSESLKKAADIDSLGSSESGWFLETERSGVLHVKVAAGKHQIEIRY